MTSLPLSVLVTLLVAVLVLRDLFGRPRGPFSG
jgi:hypothetical protein